MKTLKWNAMNRKIYLIAIMAVVALSASAQQKLYLSTYKGTDLTNYAGKKCQVTAVRQVFQGWNTVSLPFDMSVEELNKTFGDACKLERLVSADEVNGIVQLNFQDCKADGLKANTPYILYYTGENVPIMITQQAEIVDAPSSISVLTRTGEEVTMAGTDEHFDGLGCYGIMAIDNADACFVKVRENTSGFYATRCYIKLSSGTTKMLRSNHLAYGDATSINAVAAIDEVVDVYNVAGTKVASQVKASQVNDMEPGVYVVKGQKIVVK